jgi:gliding motility-associated-like protein
MSLFVSAQEETSNWFYYSNRVQVKTTGVNTAIPPVPGLFKVFQTSTSISDASGALLFVTNGSTILNRDLSEMPAIANIDLGGLYGKVLIHQIPGSSRYYVFYLVNNNDDNIRDNDSWTLKYAIVDLSLQGGKGDVVTYNQVIETKSSPSFAIIEGKQPDEAWLIVHKLTSDNFSAYQINNAGLAPSPVQSTAGSHNIKSEYIFRDLKASFDGSMIGGISYIDQTNFFAYTLSITEVFNFDGSTGKLTSKVRTPRIPGYFLTYLTVEFSPDSKLLYTSEATRAFGLQPCGFGSGTIRQYRVCFSDTAAFFDNRYTVATDFRRCGPSATWGKMLLGADKRIHIPFSGTIVSVINNPNKIGSSCNYVFEGYNLSATNNGEVGAPQFNPIVMKKAVGNNIVYEGGCFPIPYKFKVSNNNISNVSWNFGDSQSPANSSTLQEPEHFFTSPGKYTVKASFFDNYLGRNVNLVDTLEVSSPSRRLLGKYPSEIILCGTTNQVLRVDPVINGAHKWYRKADWGRIIDVQIGDSAVISQSGKWYVMLEQDHCIGCTILDSIDIKIIDRNAISGERSLCNGDSLKLQANFNPDATYSWNTGEITNGIVARSSGEYVLQTTYARYGCTFSDTIKVKSLPGVSFALPGDTLLCSGQKLLLSPNLQNVYYTWQDGSSTQTFNVTAPGKYWVRVTNYSFCSAVDTIQVSYIGAEKPSLGIDTSLCQGQSLVLSTSISAGNFMWSTGERTKSITVNTQGSYWVKVDNGLCTTGDTIAVSFKSPPNLDLGRDTTLCGGSQLQLRTSIINATYLWQDGAATPQYQVIKEGLYWLKVIKDGCQVTDTILITYTVPSKPNLGPDLRFCIGDSRILDAGSSGSSFEWSTGQTTRTIAVSNPGNYIVAVKSNNQCVARDTLTVLNYFPTPTVELGASGPLCIGTDARLDAGNPGANYLWSTGSTSRTINVQQAGLYWVRITNEYGCRSSDSISITGLLAAPSNFLPSDSTICKYQAVTISSRIPFRQYNWSNGSTSNSITVSSAGSYVLRVVDNNNCTGIDTISLVPKNDCITGVFVPNAFTPGGDGKNDSFRPLFSGNVEKYQFTVYNRFGEIVFNSSKPDQAWDGYFKGQLQPTGVFTWIFRYQLSGLPPEVKKGTVVLIR